MRIAVDDALPLQFFPGIEKSVCIDGKPCARFLLKCFNIVSDEAEIVLTDDKNTADILFEKRPDENKPKKRVLFSANREDLIRYTELYDTFFDIHPVFSIGFRGVDFVIDNGFDWVVFTSKRAVDFFFEKVAARFMCDKKIAAVGEKTALRLQERGFEVNYVPEEYYGESLLDFLRQKRNVAVIAPVKHNVRFDELENITVIPVYENIVPEEIKFFKPEGEFDFGLFSSPSAFWHIKEAFGDYGFAERIKRIIAIGKTTKKYINSCGFEAEIPEKATIESMFEYIKG